MIPEKMSAVRQYSEGGALTVESVPVPTPGPGEVLVKIAAAPLNPSDLSYIKGLYGTPEQFPVTPGFEGSGTVVAAGKGVLSSLLIGKRVACSGKSRGDGTWAEYMVTGATSCVPLSKHISFEQGSMLLVNPMTAIALVQIAKKGKHSAMVNNAAASALGRMMVSLTASCNLPLVSIVRKEAQERVLRNMGAQYVLNSADETFPEALQKLMRDLKATLILDAVGGTAGTRLIELAPPRSKIISYAALSGENTAFDPRVLLREQKVIEGFQLGQHLQSMGMAGKLRLAWKARKFLEQGEQITVQKIFPLSGINEAVAHYSEHMGSGKILVRP
ncbi:MAG: zinc-binding dehydrogenase [Bacteroidales bacterium]|nr:zinc-binding dehydrogenase [Bacteroidales bacterium]MBN2697793.1 zinc-binding dehydrogenase [Bacteroidales bacterium]